MSRDETGTLPARAAAGDTSASCANVRGAFLLFAYQTVLVLVLLGVVAVGLVLG